ncbi:hypothetical protein GCM10027569_25650 [Flindersiella endophytica]
MQQPVLPGRVRAGLPVRCGEEPVGGVGSNRCLGQPGVDLGEVDVDPLDQTWVEPVAGADRAGEVPGVDGAVGGPYRERLRTGHLPERIVEQALQDSLLGERRRALVDRTFVRPDRIGAKGVGVAQPEEVRAASTARQACVVEVSACHVVDELADVPLVAGRGPDPLARAHLA